MVVFFLFFFFTKGGEEKKARKRGKIERKNLGQGDEEKKARTKEKEGKDEEKRGLFFSSFLVLSSAVSTNLSTHLAIVQFS